MSKHLIAAMGLPSLDDALRESGALDVDDTELPVQMESQSGTGQSQIERFLDGDDHGRKMDAIHDEVLDHAQKVMDLGYNIDPARAPRMFEVATGLYKAAMDAANSKKDAQLKAVKLMQDQIKLDIERRKMGDISSGDIEAQAVVVEDRNDLIKRLREQAAASK